MTTKEIDDLKESIKLITYTEGEQRDIHMTRLLQNFTQTNYVYVKNKVCYTSDGKRLGEFKKIKDDNYKYDDKYYFCLDEEL